MTVCGKINYAFSTLVVVLSASWFTLIVLMCENVRDFRVDFLGLRDDRPIEDQPSMYLNPINLQQMYSPPHPETSESSTSSSPKS